MFSMNHRCRPLQHGQSLVTYALLLPIVVLSLGLIIDLGSMLYRYSIGQTVVAGAAYAAATAFECSGVKRCIGNHCATNPPSRNRFAINS